MDVFIITGACTMLKAYTRHAYRYAPNDYQRFVFPLHSRYVAARIIAVRAVRPTL